MSVSETSFIAIGMGGNVLYGSETSYKAIC